MLTVVVQCSAGIWASGASSPSVTSLFLPEKFWTQFFASLRSSFDSVFIPGKGTSFSELYTAWPKNKSENHHVKVLTFSFPIDQSLSEENFRLFCMQDQLSFSSHQVLQGKEWKQNGRTLCESSFVHFWNHSFYWKKNSQSKFFLGILSSDVVFLCWYI